MDKKPKIGERVIFNDQVGTVVDVELRYHVTIEFENRPSKHLRMSHIDSKGIEPVTEAKDAGEKDKRRVPVRKEGKVVSG
jgi:hypothetical protein